MRFAGHAPVPLDVRHNVLSVDFGAVPVASLLLVTNQRSTAREKRTKRQPLNTALVTNSWAMSLDLSVNKAHAAMAHGRT